MTTSTRNILHVGRPLALLAVQPADSVDLVWLDTTNLGAIADEPVAGSPEQLALFERSTKPERFDETGSNTQVLDRLCKQVHRVLRPTGHVFALCDPLASHRIKTLLDTLFGESRFVREFVILRSAKDPRRISHRVILVFGKTALATLHRVSVDVPDARLRSLYRYKEPGSAERYALGDCVNSSQGRDDLRYEWKGIVRVWRWTRDVMAELDSSGRLVYTKGGLPRVKRYLNEVSKRPIGSVWSDLDQGAYDDAEDGRMARVIELGSNAGDTIVDVNCVRASLLLSATKRSRSWIGLSPTHHHAAAVRTDLRKAFGSAADDLYSFFGPHTARAAIGLMRAAPAEFKSWVLGELGVELRRRQRIEDADIDGRISMRNKSHSVRVVVRHDTIDANEMRKLKDVARREDSLLVVIAPEKSRRLQMEHLWRDEPNLVFVPVENFCRPPTSSRLVEFERMFVRLTSERRSTGKSRLRRRSA